VRLPRNGGYCVGVRRFTRRESAIRWLWHDASGSGGRGSGFVPDPNYTWVPRTNVRPKEPETTTTTTTPTTNQPDVADGVHADDNGGSRAAGTADHHGDAYAPTTPPAPGSGPALTTSAPPR